MHVVSCVQVYGPQLPQKLCEVVTSGIPVTINSDDPAYFGAYLNSNYEYIASISHLGADDLAQLARNSFTASFIPEEEKAAALLQVDAVLDAWKAEQQQQQQQMLASR
jgi:adenosine deaminase